MEQGWQQVSRRRRGKPRRGSSQPRNAPLKTSTAPTNGGEEVVEPVPEVSAEKQIQIIRRVCAIVDVLRESLLLKDTLRVVMDQFESGVVKKTVETDDRPTLVGYGLGSFCASSNAVHQLGFLVALKEVLYGENAGGDAKDVKVADRRLLCAEIFDPAMNKSDAAIAEHFQVKVIEENEHGRRRVARNTVFFMPHCGKTLYENVLACNWGPAAKKLVVIGNSFSAYGDRVLAAKEREDLLLVRVLPYLQEVALPCGVAKSHDDFVRYEAAFNDLSVHRFPSELLDEALGDTELNARMAAAERPASTE